MCALCACTASPAASLPQTDDPNKQTFCIGVGGDKGRPLPPPSSFVVPQLNTDQWAAVAASFGARYAVLTTMHCSGFALWATNVTLPSGAPYGYSVAFGGTTTDVVDAFVRSFTGRGLGVGAYYRCVERCDDAGYTRAPLCTCLRRDGAAAVIVRAAASSSRCHCQPMPPTAITAADRAPGCRVAAPRLHFASRVAPSLLRRRRHYRHRRRWHPTPQRPEVSERSV